MSECQHEDFLANVDVTRLEDSGRFAADVRIQCTQCETPFRFIGLPAGCDLNGAATSMDATEARLAIAPKGEVMPAVDGAPHGFSVRIDPDSEKMLPAMRISKLEREIESLRAELAKHRIDKDLIHVPEKFIAPIIDTVDGEIVAVRRLAPGTKIVDDSGEQFGLVYGFRRIDGEGVAIVASRVRPINACPVCFHQFEMGQPPHFKPEESGEGHDGERTVYWVSGTQTCPECGATWPYGDSD